jgi:hypothetical protein
MQKDLNIKKIQLKFQELIQLDENRKHEEEINSVNRSYINSILTSQSVSSHPKEEQIHKEEKKAANQAD